MGWAQNHEVLIWSLTQCPRLGLGAVPIEGLSIFKEMHP